MQNKRNKKLQQTLELKQLLSHDQASQAESKFGQIIFSKPFASQANDFSNSQTAEALQLASFEQPAFQMQSVGVQNFGNNIVSEPIEKGQVHYSQMESRKKESLRDFTNAECKV